MLKFEEIYNLQGYHLEADTLVMFHTKHADLKDFGNIVVSGGYTDFDITLSCNTEKLENGHFWYDFRVNYNSRLCIDITELPKNTKIIMKAQPGKYTYTGNVYTPAFSKKGKTQPI